PRLADRFLHPVFEDIGQRRNLDVRRAGKDVLQCLRSTPAATDEACFERFVRPTADQLRANDLERCRARGRGREEASARGLHGHLQRTSILYPFVRNGQRACGYFADTTSRIAAATNSGSCSW